MIGLTPPKFSMIILFPRFLFIKAVVAVAIVDIVVVLIVAIAVGEIITVLVM